MYLLGIEALVLSYKYIYFHCFYLDKSFQFSYKRGHCYLY